MYGGARGVVDAVDDGDDDEKTTTSWRKSQQNRGGCQMDRFFRGCLPNQRRSTLIAFFGKDATDVTTPICHSLALLLAR